MNINGIRADIDRILYPYLSVNSETCTAGEKEAESYLLKVLGDIKYFRNNQNQYGAFPIPQDPFGRSVCWGLLRGAGERTVVLLHHYDVVNVEDFKTFKDFAFRPGELEKELFKIKDELHKEAAEDLSSGEYLFGRGTADMKAGGAIQLALLARLSEGKELNGNVLLLAIPDEENLSAGMRGAILLLSELRQKFGLRFVYAINSEPHQRKTADAGVISEGSVGKMLAFVYVRGFLAHVGKVFEGLNPLAILSKIAVDVELSQEFSDVVHGEAAPPPTWLYLRDRKKEYSVSMPLGAGGCVSILTLSSDPALILEKLVKISRTAFDETLQKINGSYEVFCGNSRRTPEALPWKTKVCTFGELLDEAKQNNDTKFLARYSAELDKINGEISKGACTFIEASFALTEFIYNYVNDASPRAVVGFVPPYYPNVSNIMLKDERNSCPGLASELISFARKEYNQAYEREFYFTGISDLSYFSLSGSETVEGALRNNMPLYGEAYSIPLAEIEKLSMPCMNIGPWGKDFHKMTERVYKPDLYERTPALLVKAIETILQDKGA